MSWSPSGLSIAKVFESEGIITNLEYHRDGRYLVASTSEGAIQIFDSLSGIQCKKVLARDHGIGSMKFTHHDSSVLLTSERVSHDIRLLCLHDNQYIRFFRGHEDKVTSLSMSPIGDNFISTSLDNTVNIWDLSSKSRVGKISIDRQFDRITASYDFNSTSSGNLFGVLAYNNRKNTHSLRLYDARNYEKGPFEDTCAPSLSAIEGGIRAAQDPSSALSSEQINRLVSAPWTSFEFSPDGSKILVNTKSEMMLILDSFSNEDNVIEPIIIVNRKNDSSISLGACFSADGQYVLSGNDDNDIQVYETLTGKTCCSLSGHVGPVSCIKANPRYDVIASGCTNTALWLRSLGSGGR
jgi:COMPASS component SWD2